MAKLLWEWKPRFAVALVVRDLLIVTSHTNCDVTSCPVVMRRYANADGDEQRYKTSKTQVSLFVNCDRGRIEIDHLYGLRCRGWYCNPEQHSLCRPARPQAAARRPAQLVLFRIAVPTTPAQTVSWSIPITNTMAWWRHQMETFSALLAICAGNSPVPGEFPAQRPVTRGVDVFFDLRPDKLLSKQSRGWWFETPSHSLWRHRNGNPIVWLPRWQWSSHEWYE